MSKLPFEIWREGNTWHAELIPEEVHSVEQLDEVDKLIAAAREEVRRVYPASVWPFNPWRVYPSKDIVPVSFRGLR